MLRFFDLQAGRDQLFNGRFRPIVVREDGDDRVSFFHFILSQDRAREAMPSQ